VQADPTIKNLTALSKSGARPLTNVGRLFKSLRKTKGFEHLMHFLYNNVGWSNSFNQFGHLLRENFLSTNCIDYATVPAGECQANFFHPTGSSSSARVARTPSLGELRRMLALDRAEKRRRQRAADKASSADRHNGGSTQQAAPAAGSGGSGGSERSARDVLKYLLGQ
jgi:hypothetical protein